MQATGITDSGLPLINALSTKVELKGNSLAL